jgi:hypothetical protein
VVRSGIIDLMVAMLVGSGAAAAGLWLAISAPDKVHTITAFTMLIALLLPHQARRHK